MPTPVIFNLNTFHDTPSISSLLTSFAALATRYDTGCLSQLPGFFSTPTNLAWTTYQFNKINQKLLQDYKLGNTSNEEFFAALANIYQFALTSPRLISGAPKKEMDPKQHLVMLLKKAWNDGYKISEKQKNDFRTRVIQASPSAPFILVSNTNPENVKAVIQLLAECGLDAKIDTQPEKNQPIKLTNNVYLYPSYQFACWKFMPEGKTGLVQRVLETFHVNNTADIPFVSPHLGDQKAAKQLGLQVIAPADLCAQDDVSSLTPGS